MSAPSFEVDGHDWPHREISGFVKVGDIQFHVQMAGDGPVLLMLHGTGAATHSWRGLLPLLRPHFTIIAPDLPGHGFTEKPYDARLSLEGMAADITALLRELELTPVMAVGHSAGAAILVQMCLTCGLKLKSVVSLCGALLPLRGVSGRTFSPIAKLLALNPLVPRIVAWRANDTASVTRLIEGTGSRIDAEGIEYYRRLTGTARHAAAALAMMANWQLEPLRRQLGTLEAHLLLVAAERDRAVTPDTARRVHRLVANSRVICIKDRGHLVHEEDPCQIAQIIRDEAITHRVLSPVF
ncbi:MAG: alpha/beta fold hydrolase BchO [Pseudomonadota bacterium]